MIFRGIPLLLVYFIGKYTEFRTERVYGVGILEVCVAKPVGGTVRFSGGYSMRTC